GARLICQRGCDGASTLGAAELGRFGVQLCGPVVEGRGGVVVSMRNTHGERTMASDRGVASTLDPSDLDPAWLATCDVLHVSGYCLLREPMAQAALAAARLAPRVTVDLASAHDIALIGADTFTARLAALGPELAFATETERAAVPAFDTAWVIKRGARRALSRGGIPGSRHRRCRHDGRWRRARRRVSGGRPGECDRGGGAVRRGGG